MQLRIGSSPTGRGLVGPVPTGENLVWSSFTHLCLGLLKNDAAMLAAVRDAMNGVAQPDHRPKASSATARSTSMARSSTPAATAARSRTTSRATRSSRGGTVVRDCRPTSLASFSDYVADGIAWTLYGNYFDVSVIGREVARPTTSGFNGIAALLQASQFDIAAQRGDPRRRREDAARRGTARCRPELAGLAAKRRGGAHPRRRGRPAIATTSPPTTRFTAATAGSPR